MREQNAEGETDGSTEREADRRLLCREQSGVPQQGSEQGTAGLARAAERREDVVDMRHGGVVDDERPGPALIAPERAITLPETPQRPEHDDE